MKIEIINGKPTRMLEDVVAKERKTLTKFMEGENYMVYTAWTDGEYGDFEVFVKTYRPKSQFDTNEGYTQVQHYPKTSEWGKIAWSYRKLENLRKFINKRFNT